MLSGYIDVDFQERGVKDYSLDAKLTLRGYTLILIKQILQYNAKHYLKAYVREKEKRSKQDANQQVGDTPSTQLQFENLANVHKTYESEQKVNHGNIYIFNKGQGGGVQKKERVVGLDESIFVGTIQPIDFKNLEDTN